MIVFVDFEHERHYRTDAGAKIQAARTWITYRLEDLSGQPCHLVRWDRVTAELLTTLNAKGLFISGNATDPAHYDPVALAPLHELIRSSGLPVFGFCGGFQCFAQALGADLVPLDIDPDFEETDMVKSGPNGRFFEFGYHPVDLVQDHALLDGLGDAPVFRHAHGLHVPALPGGFVTLARTDVTPIQLAVNDERRMVGTQFHPEYWTDEHQAGKTLIANFLRWADLN